MDYTIRPIADEDGKAIIDIFNYYVDNTFAAYPDRLLPYQAFAALLHKAEGLPTGTLSDPKGNVAGFGMLRPHNPIATFSHTAEATYFLHPDHTGKGVGKMVLEYLEKGARVQGITNILAHISSRNPNSIKFHRKNGFSECGRFRNVGRKKGQEFDLVWMQKILCQ